LYPDSKGSQKMKIKRPKLNLNEYNFDILIGLDSTKQNYNLEMLEGTAFNLAELSLDTWDQNFIRVARFYAKKLKQVLKATEFYKKYNFQAIEWAPIYLEEKEKLEESNSHIKQIEYIQSTIGHEES